MFGCDQYPSGYDLTARRGLGVGGAVTLRCDQPAALGWVGALLMLTIVIFGGFVLPTVLIGIVAISFEEATRKAANMQEMMSKMDEVMEEAKLKMPGFVTKARVDKIRSVFDEMDADGELAMDTNEMQGFYEISFQQCFGVTFQGRQADSLEGLFHLMDLDGGGEVGFAEFLLFVVTLKSVQKACDANSAFARGVFDGLDSKYGTASSPKSAKQPFASAPEPKGGKHNNGKTQTASGEAETKEETANNTTTNQVIAMLNGQGGSSAATASGSGDLSGGGGQRRPPVPAASLAAVVEAASNSVGAAFGLRAVAVAKTLRPRQKPKPLDAPKAAAGDAALGVRLAQAITAELLFAARTLDAPSPQDLEQVRTPTPLHPLD